MRSRFTDRLAAPIWLGAGLVVPILLAVVHVVHRLEDRVLRFDALTLFAPYFTLLGDYARDGRLLWWNPWSNCGSPDGAYVEMGSFSPLSIALAWATGGGDAGFSVYWLTIWALGGVGVVMLGRHLGAPAWGAVAVALGFTFSGFYVGHATHTSWLYGFSFLPWMVWRLDRALADATLRRSAEAGGLYGLSALAGHPALVVLNGLTLAGWAVGRALASDPQRSHAQRGARGLLALATLLVVGSLVLLPAYATFFVEAAGYADRSGFLPRAVAVGDQALPVGALATLASPQLQVVVFEHPELWPGVWFGLACTYVGSLVPALALLALWMRPADRWRWWALGMALLALACAVGPALPVRGWLYDLLPPTRFFRHTAVFRAYFLFWLVVLALLGARSLAGAPRPGWQRLAAAGALLFAAALGAYAYALGWVPGSTPLGAHGHFALVWLGVPAIAWAARSGEGSGRRAAPALLVALALADGGATYLRSRPLMSLPREALGVGLPRHERSLELGSLWRSRYPPGRYPPNANLVSKVPMLENFNTLNNRFHTRVGVGSAKWFNLETSWSDEPVLASSVVGRRSRIWFSPEVGEMVPTDDHFEAFVARARALGAMPLLVHEADDLVAATRRTGVVPERTDDAAVVASLPAAQRVEAELLRYEPDALALRVEVPDDGWLLVTDRWARGWRAWVDGRRTPIRPGNFLFRALPVARGEHEITFRYQPFGRPWLVLASWGTLLGIVVFSTGGALQARRTRTEESP